MPGTHRLSAPFTFNASAGASEIWIVGEPGSFLEAEGNNAALTFSEGAPRVHLHDLHFSKGLALNVEGGHVMIKGCNCSGRPTDTGVPLHRRLGEATFLRRALTVNHGTVYISGTTFSNLEGGAIEITGGTVDIDQATLHDNSGDKGGALLITEGLVRLTGVLFRRNHAQTSGGALHVDGGVVELARETHFADNKTPQGASLCASDP
jgi:predicted outer membrane repeat protein